MADEGTVLFGTVGSPKPPETKPDLCAKSKEYYGTTNNIKEAGYILKDGTMLDFSGRHEAVGYEKGKPKPGEPDYLKGTRNVDHRDVKQIIPNLDQPYDKMIRFMKECRAIRAMSTKDTLGNLSLNIEFIKDITKEQENVLEHFEGCGGFIEIDDLNGISVCSKEFDRFTVLGLKDEIAKCRPKIHPKGHIIVEL